jgi:hypothetical protein
VIQRWLAKRPRYQRHFTPKGASWINLVERWFALLTDKQLPRGVHRSTRDLETAIDRYVQIYNDEPRPFRWTKTADEILASVARLCHRISDSGHWASLGLIVRERRHGSAQHRFSRGGPDESTGNNCACRSAGASGSSCRSTRRTCDYHRDLRVWACWRWSSAISLSPALPWPFTWIPLVAVLFPPALSAFPLKDIVVKRDRIGALSLLIAEFERIQSAGGSGAERTVHPTAPGAGLSNPV